MLKNAMTSKIEETTLKFRKKTDNLKKQMSQLKDLLENSICSDKQHIAEISLMKQEIRDKSMRITDMEGQISKQDISKQFKSFEDDVIRLSTTNLLANDT